MARKKPKSGKLRAKSKPTNPEQRSKLTEWIPRIPGIIGFSILLAGFSLLSSFFWRGVIAIYIGLALLVWEICVEPELIKRSARIQIVAIAIVFSLFGYITIRIVVAPAPLNLTSYAMRNGEYPPGTVIAGIPWDTHFTDLRVAITNPSTSDYQNLDLALQPNKWAHKAGLLSGPLGCELTPIDGNSISVSRIQTSGDLTVTATRVGAGVDTHDSAGDVYRPLATESGYRLRCGQFPAHSTIQVVFAIVAINPDFAPKSEGVSGWGFTATELAGVTSDFDLLGPRPFPSAVSAQGYYISVNKPFSLMENMHVKDGN